ALVAEFLRGFVDKHAPVDRGRIDRHFVRTAGQQSANIVHRAHAATDGKRHEARFRGSRHNIVYRFAHFVAGRYIEQVEPVGAGCIVSDCSLDRITRVAQIDEIDALDHSAVFHVETGDYADLEHQADAFEAWMRLSASAASRRPS